MRIISRFHDYYDGVMSFGHDDRVIYLRDEEPLVTGERQPKAYRWLDPGFRFDFSELKVKGGWLSVEGVSIFFCGKIYVGLRFTYHTDLYVTAKRETFYTVDSINNYLAQFELTIDDVFRKTWRSKKMVSRFYLDSHHSSLEIGVTENEALLTRAIDQRVVAMSMLVHGRWHQLYTVVKNPQLSVYDFYRARDPFQVYQDIDMFLSGVLAPENKPMITISDTCKRDQHGFDQWSFKKLPSKRRSK